MAGEPNHGLILKSNSVLSDDLFFFTPDSDHVPLVHELPSRPVVMVNAAVVDPKLSPRRFSTGNIVIPYTKVKILSRYLAASTGSCHDNCKYGSKEVPQEIPRKSSMLKRAQQGQGLEKYARALSSSFKSLKPNIPASLKKVGGSANGSSSRNPLPRHTQSKPIYLTGTGGCSIGIRDCHVTEKEVTKSFATSLKGRTAVGGGYSDSKAPEKKVIRSIATSLPGVSSSKGKTGVRESKMTSSIQDEKKASMRPTASFSARHHMKKVLTPSTYSLSPKRSAKSVPRMKSNPESMKNRTRVSRCKKDVRRAEREHHSCTNAVEPNNGKEMNRKPKSKTRLETGGVSQARNRCFRAGKVVERPSDCNSSRRLKYGERVLLDPQLDEAESAEVILKETEGEIDKMDDAPESEAGKVVLRHQEVEAKKRERRLLNNMIKETATKLSASRKSKVKALVGAFETVISLQESKKLVTVQARLKG